MPSMTAWHESVTCLPDKRSLGADDIGFSPPVPSSSSGQAGVGDSCCCFSTTPSSATTMLFHHCSSSPNSSQKQTRSSSSSSTQKLIHSSCSVRSEAHVNGHGHVLCCSGWCSNDLAAFSLDDCRIKWVRLDGGAWLSLACTPFRSARASICARLASVASRWSCNSHTISYARLCISTPHCWVASVDSPRLRNPTSGASPLCIRSMACRRASDQSM